MIGFGSAINVTRCTVDVSRWPDTIKAIRDAGHEIGHHGYLHEPLGADEATEERHIVRGLEALDRVLGMRPVGYRAPNWETSYRTPALLARHLPTLGPQQTRWVHDALAVAAYQAQTDWPVVRLLVCDDAPQWQGVTEALALCWIHEGRHYKKLWPEIAAHRVLLDDLLTRFWAYYGELRAYREAPTGADRIRLATAFEDLFATRTGYYALDDRL